LPHDDPIDLNPDSGSTMISPVPTLTTRNVRPRRRPAAAAAATAHDQGVATGTSRQAVSAAELLAFINDEVSARLECAGLKVRARAWCPGTDGDDCNWSETGLVLHVAGAVSAGAFQELRKVIAIARERYDLLASEAHPR
jgi:hypothetical protein